MTGAVADPPGVTTRAVRGKRSVRRAAADELDAAPRDERDQDKEQAPVTAEERAIAAAGLSAFVSKAERRNFQTDIRNNSGERAYLSIRRVAFSSSEWSSIFLFTRQRSEVTFPPQLQEQDSDALGAGRHRRGH